MARCGALTVEARPTAGSLGNRLSRRVLRDRINTEQSALPLQRSSSIGRHGSSEMEGARCGCGGRPQTCDPRE